MIDCAEPEGAIPGLEMIHIELAVNSEYVPNMEGPIEACGYEGALPPKCNSGSPIHFLLIRASLLNLK